MARYASGLIPALKHVGVTTRVMGSTDNLSFWQRYPGYLWRAFRAGSFSNVILSERFSFLLAVMVKRRSVVVCHDLISLHYEKQSFFHKIWYLRFKNVYDCFINFERESMRIIVGTKLSF